MHSPKEKPRERICSKAKKKIKANYTTGTQADPRTTLSFVFVAGLLAQGLGRRFAFVPVLFVTGLFVTSLFVPGLSGPGNDLSVQSHKQNSKVERTSLASVVRSSEPANNDQQAPSSAHIQPTRWQDDRPLASLSLIPPLPIAGYFHRRRVYR